MPMIWLHQPLANPIETTIVIIIIIVIILCYIVGTIESIVGVSRSKQIFIKSSMKK